MGVRRTQRCAAAAVRPSAVGGHRRASGPPLFVPSSSVRAPNVVRRDMPRLKPPTLRWPAAASLVRRVCHRSISSTRVLHDEKDKPTHSDIPSFLRYAESVTLLRETTVFVGTMFEYSTTPRPVSPVRLLTSCKIYSAAGPREAGHDSHAHGWTWGPGH